MSPAVIDRRASTRFTPAAATTSSPIGLAGQGGDIRRLREALVAPHPP